MFGPRQTILAALFITLAHADDWAVPQKSEDFHIFLLMGQSNMAGYGGVPENDPYLPGDKDPVPQVLMLGGQGTADAAKPLTPIEWKPAAHPLHSVQRTARFGLGLDFAKTYLKSHPGVTVGLIPCAWGGAAIDKLRKGSPVYQNAIERMHFARTQGIIKGVLWHQGESDTVDKTHVAAYRAKLTGLISDLRQEAEDVALPFVIGELAPFYGTHKDHAKRLDLINQVRVIHHDIGTTYPFCAHVPSVGLTDKQGAGVHLDRASLIEFGQRYAAAYLELEAKGPIKTTIPADYQLIWQDEFDGDKLDTTKWAFPSYKVREAAAVNTAGTVIVSDGTLKLRAFQRDGQLHAAIIETRGKLQRRYGWYEARMKMHRLQGLHSCFWLQTPTFNKFPNDPAQSGTEMDIMEWFGAGRRSGWAGMNIYYRGEKGNVRSPSIPKFALMGGPDEKQPNSPLADLSETFHVYAAHWTPEACVFYCDGIEILRDTQAVSQVEQYLILSLLSSNWERPRLKLEALPDELTVDYVRVYGRR